MTSWALVSQAICSIPIPWPQSLLKPWFREEPCLTSAFSLCLRGVRQGLTSRHFKLPKPIPQHWCCSLCLQNHFNPFLCTPTRLWFEFGIPINTVWLCYCGVVFFGTALEEIKAFKFSILVFIFPSKTQHFYDKRSNYVDHEIDKHHNTISFI